MARIQPLPPDFADRPSFRLEIVLGKPTKSVVLTQTRLIFERKRENKKENQKYPKFKL